MFLRPILILFELDQTAYQSFAGEENETKSQLHLILIFGMVDQETHH